MAGEFFKFANCQLCVVQCNSGYKYYFFFKHNRTHDFWKDKREADFALDIETIIQTQQKYSATLIIRINWDQAMCGVLVLILSKGNTTCKHHLDAYIFLYTCESCLQLFFFVQAKWRFLCRGVTHKYMRNTVCDIA